MKNQIIILAIIALVGFGGYTLYQKSLQSDSMMQSDKAMMPKEESPVEPTDAMMKKESGAVEDEKMMDTQETGMVGSYVPYSAEKVAMADTGDVVLFFHASWCPTCSALNKDIEMSLKDIPSGVTILKTDYDKEMELKKKYGVTYQHTLVQVDAKGNMIKKWSGGLKLENLLSEIK